MNLPSATLLAQSVLAGLFTGALYGLLGLGLSLSWGMLRQINLAHFALAFLGAYLTYELSSRRGVDPLLTLVVIVPLFFVLGVALHWVLTRFRVSPFNSLLVTFGITVIIEALHPVDLDRRLPQAGVELRGAQAAARPAVPAGAGTDHAGAGRGHLARGVARAAPHRPRQGDARRGARTRRSPPPSASTRTRWR